MTTEQEQIKEGIDYCLRHFESTFKSAKGTTVKMSGEAANEMIQNVVDACVKVGFKFGKRAVKKTDPEPVSFLREFPPIEEQKVDWDSLWEDFKQFYPNAKRSSEVFDWFKSKIK